MTTQTQTRKPKAARSDGRAEYETNFGAFLRHVAVKDGYQGGFGQVMEATALPSGANSTVPSEGGHAVPPEVAADLWTTVYDTGRLLQLTTPVPVTRGNEVRVPAIREPSRGDGSRFGTVSLGWSVEGETPTTSTLKLRAAVYQLRKLFGLTYASEELLEDAPLLDATLRRLFALEASFAVEDEMVNGDGARGPKGILTAPATITVAKEGAQAANTIVPENVVKMLARLWAPSHARAVWLANLDTLPQLMSLALDSGSGVVPLWSYAPDGTPMLAGRPVLWTEYNATLGTRGDLILADLSQYGVADKQEVRGERSIHVNFLQFESAFRFAWRVDGQPLWNEAITPKNGTATVSPFVTLADRA